MLSSDRPKLTDEGMEILDRVRTTDDNIMVEAYAGTGKTTIAKAICEDSPQQPVLYLVFARSDVKEAENKGFPSTTKVQNLNSLGHRVWSAAVGKATVETDDLRRPIKMQRLLKEQINALKGDDRNEVSEAYSDILAAASMAKHLGYIPNGKFPHARRLTSWEELSSRIEAKLSPLCQAIVDNVLNESIKTAYNGTIDFDDQIYMSGLFGGTFPRFPHVVVDEDQDLSPTNHAMLDKLCKNRITAVGDRWQSIYYFRGAEVGGVDKIKAKFNMVEMPLSHSFRCPKAIVEAARWRVPTYKWVKDGGRYEVLQGLDPDTIPEGAAIVCRNNAPLLSAAFALLSRKRSVQVAGSDIGPKIIRLLRKIGAEGDSQEDLLFKIDAWREEKLLTTNSPSTIFDQAECLKVFATWGASFSQAIGYADHIFRQQGSIILTTGHKAKGKEWDVVYHLDPTLIGKDDQDLNLKYVIQTRAKQAAYEINMKDIQWE